MTLEDMRRNYSRGHLQRADLAADPIEQFQRWFGDLQHAAVPEWFERNAMVLSTTDVNGRVSSRVVLLKSISAEGFAFFTNYQSAKAQQLAANAYAALNFYWPMLERQIRVEGPVQPVAAALSDEYFRGRPFRSRLAAIVSPQSTVIGEDNTFHDEVNRLAESYPDENVPRPAYWGGYCVTPLKVEFWHGRPSRLHDRFEYRREAERWNIVRLAP
jgi:pyridoxamine 5'-phosphate oxidase